MKALIIDDERLARKEILRLLENHPDVEIVGEAANSEEALALIDEKEPELLFLDIQMPGKSGLDLLTDLDHAPEVIFVTAYDEYAIKAFDVNALDYLLKPVEEVRLAEAIQKVKDKISLREAQQTENISKEALSSSDQIFIKDGEKCWFVQLTDVRLFESEGNYVRVYFNNYKPLILRSLNQLEERLNERQFFRTSRKHIVNLSWIDGIEPWFNGGLRCTLKDGKEIEVSRRQAARFKELKSL
ncbi:MAG: LytTR family transcriptional regulator DNA-binding domain-containing protein [Flavobacteriales bacterium]|nr:LytTR family transcriptional regulator DNA-binding domain-containing protein [Flavobacteriales bacterium]MDG2244947.1 LytTR family transcriptional regulator DNA-binding domain-containing protein [Flavobacteriales bacterium]